MAKYMTPDFDVTVYEIKEAITSMDGDDITSIADDEWKGDVSFG